MIFAGFLAAAVFPGRFVEESVPSAQSTLIEAAIVFPYLTPSDRAAEEIIAACLFEGTADFTKAQLKAYTTFMGEPLRCTATPDCLRVTIGVRRDDWKTGLRILKSALQSPNLTAESIEQAKATLPFQNQSAWKSAVEPSLLPYDQIRKRDVDDFMRRNIVPQAMSIVVSGPFVPGEPRSFWTDEEGPWDPSKQLRFPADRRPEKISRRPGVALDILRWGGPEIAPTPEALAAPLLAAYCLGTGKDSSAFRILREKNRLSYRQEVQLCPVGDGFHLLLTMAFTRRGSDVASTVGPAMLADIESWTDASKARGLEMATASLSLHAFAAPLAITNDGVLGPDDYRFAEAYWPMKTGRPWSSKELVGLLSNVSLDDLKRAARDLFEKGTHIKSE